MTTPPVIAVVGYGYWGPKLVRNFRSHGCVVIVCDASLSQLHRAGTDFAGIECVQDYDLLLRIKDLDAVAIATPVDTHYDLAHKALLHRKHVLVEKPLTSSVGHAKHLVELAHELDLALMVDHTFLYHPAIQRIKETINRGELGSMHYMDSTRVNLGLFQPDVNVIWDLAVHDISIALHVFPDRPNSVQAIGSAHGGAGPADVGSLFLRYFNGMFVRINVSWLSPVKLRFMVFGGSAKMLVYDDLNLVEPIKILDSGFIRTKAGRYDYRTGDIFSPKLESREALAALTGDFLKHIKGESDCRSDGNFGLEVVRILTAAERSLELGGMEVKL